MDLRLERDPTTDGVTMGHLFADGRFLAFTLEDAVHRGPKVPGETAIPAGRYRVTITPSQRFGRMLPLLHDVPGFAGVRLHPGNVGADTAGCILVGLARTTAALESSRAAMEVVQPLIARALASHNDVFLTIQDAPPAGTPQESLQA